MRIKYFGKDCSAVTKTIPGQAMSISEIIRRTMRGEAINLSSNYYYEESVLPTDRLDTDVFDVQRAYERSKQKLADVQQAIKQAEQQNAAAQAAEDGATAPITTTQGSGEQPLSKAS